MPQGKEDRAQLIQLVVEWIRALHELNQAWVDMLKSSCQSSTKTERVDSHASHCRVEPNSEVKSMDATKSRLNNGSASPMTGGGKLSQANYQDIRYSVDEPLPRLLLVNRCKHRGVLPEQLRIEICGGKEVLQGWLWVAHTLLVGWKTARLFADTDESDLRCLVDRIKSSAHQAGARCGDAVRNRKPFDGLKYAAVEYHLALIFEGDYWASVSSTLASDLL